MIVDCISDLHGHYPNLEGGDLLIVAGDLTASDRAHQYIEFFSWLNRQDYSKIVFIAGNHDNLLWEISPLPESLPENVSYLCDSGTEFEGVKIWGSPWSKTFPGMNPKCKAFTVDTEEELAEKFDLIPDETDILVCHTPFLHMLDQNIQGYHCGSHSLRKAIDRVQPRLFVCGHIHEQGGNQIMYKHVGKNTWCVNASYVNERYQPVNKPIRINL